MEEKNIQKERYKEKSLRRETEKQKNYIAVFRKECTDVGTDEKKISV